MDSPLPNLRSLTGSVYPLGACPLGVCPFGAIVPRGRHKVFEHCASPLKIHPKAILKILKSPEGMPVALKIPHRGKLILTV